MIRQLMMAGLCVAGGASLAAAGEVDYARDVRAVLKERCWSCHGALKQESGLRLDTVELMTEGGSSGPVLVPNQPRESKLWRRITARDPARRMPPEGAPLSAEQARSIEDWITQGLWGRPTKLPNPIRVVTGRFSLPSVGSSRAPCGCVRPSDRRLRGNHARARGADSRPAGRQGHASTAGVPRPCGGPSDA